MKAGQTQNSIAQILGRHKSTIGRELMRVFGHRGHRLRQSQNQAVERSRCYRNATQISPEVWCSVRDFLSLQSSPEQTASQLQISHETIDQKLYADKALGDRSWSSLRCHRQKSKRYLVAVIDEVKLQVAAPLLFGLN